MEPATTWVASFYRFHPINEVGALCMALEQACRERSLRGTVLLAPEGVNAALSGSRPALECLIAAHFAGVDVKWSTAAPGNSTFRRLKVREKNEIVSFGRTLSPSMPVGVHVDASAWNQLLDDPNVLVLDTRNGYESAIGTFRGAMCTDTASFREFPDFVRRELEPARHPRIALFCTGGIRCEKASAHLLEQGFETVCQLDGGILKYLAETDPKASAFEGDCFVFDQRVSVNSDLAQGSYQQCHACR